MKDIVEIIQWFSELSSKIKLSNKLNLIDINIYCENDLLQILNEIYGWELYNANAKHKNAKAIDLIDDKNRIAIQITSDKSVKKINETINKFKETKFSNYEFYMFYLTDDLPDNIKKNISKNNIKSFCFLDLIQELHFNPLKAKKIITKITKKTIIERFQEYLKYPEKWSFDDKLNIYYNNIDPNFRLKFRECNEENENYSWLNEIKAISKRYENARIHYNDIQLFYNDIYLNINTFSAEFYQEGLIIAIPNNLYFHEKKDLYFDGYICGDMDSLLTYFFNFEDKKILYEEFVKTKEVLKYKKPSYEYIPLIFFKDRNELENFKKFVDKRIDDFDYEKNKNKYDSLDFKIKDERGHKNCCFNFWIYELYWNEFKKHDER